MNAKLKEIFGVKIVSKSPRTDAVWERLATDTTGELEPDVEFSTLARQLEYELYEAKDRIKRLEEIINRASLAFFSDASHRKVSIAMHTILEEFTREAKL